MNKIILILIVICCVESAICIHYAVSLWFNESDANNPPDQPLLLSPEDVAMKEFESCIQHAGLSDELKRHENGDDVIIFTKRINPSAPSFTDIAIDSFYKTELFKGRFQELSKMFHYDTKWKQRCGSLIYGLLVDRYAKLIIELPYIVPKEYLPELVSALGNILKYTGTKWANTSDPIFKLKTLWMKYSAVLEREGIHVDDMYYSK